MKQSLFTHTYPPTTNDINAQPNLAPPSSSSSSCDSHHQPPPPPPPTSKLITRPRRVRKRHSKSTKHSPRSLRKMKEHNQKFKKMTQRIKQFLRDETCPTLQPLSTAEKQHIIDTVKADECATLPLCTHLGQECDIQHLITQMLFRLGEGRGACVYQIGVEDSGHPKGLCDDELIASITTIFLMAKQLRATASLTAIRRGTDGKMATLSIRRVTHIETRIEEEQKHVLNGNDIRVCVA
eukprot:CAMPEP_0202728250 /NCGR_PEP_ID=MMETSP1385-20130828/185531_1 /ASSEMBLY_ACC=CAM_ASM_000861 /TAXON_ID=933848 /ORGANISM="Elphidium margaritaceum" /LENGTH=237 /DNA_ID=CAMNT_0049394497 /DNA_START=68 /DNA_END=777 /DNA_ORIENTATION=+